MTPQQVMQEMMLSFTPAQRVKAAPYVGAILRYVEDQNDVIRHLVVAQVPIGTKLSAPPFA